MVIINYFNVILKISKLSQNDLKSDFVKSSINSLNTLNITNLKHRNSEPMFDCSGISIFDICFPIIKKLSKPLIYCSIWSVPHRLYSFWNQVYFMINFILDTVPAQGLVLIDLFPCSRECY
jgi:hypothetical protein